jgi:uncharacterized membrane-anchored protein YhcB (DUF1043 family)
MNGGGIDFRISYWEIGAAVVYVALVLAYLEYQAEQRKARNLGKVQYELERLNRNIEDVRDQDPGDDFEHAKVGCPCA